MGVLHDMGVKIVILSSTDFSSENESVCLASKRGNGTTETARISFPTLPAHFVGTGDLFTALMTSWLHHDKQCITSALEKTISTMQSVLGRTLKYALTKSAQPSPAQLELKLIQSREDILKPNVSIKATKIA